MGIESINSECKFPNVQLFQSGSVCDTFQSQSPTLCVPSSGHQTLAIDAFYIEIGPVVSDMKIFKVFYIDI